LKILYIAYSCMPNKGSEEKIGWNIPLEASKTNEVFVLTKEEHRKAINEYVSENKIDNIKFYFCDIPVVYKKLFKGVAYSMRLNFWHKNAYSLVEEICRTENIEIVHQITPIEFRSIGRYAEIPNIKFICGPLGGGEFLPDGLRCYAKGNLFVEWMREKLNKNALKKYEKTNKLSACSYIMFANRETKKYLAELTVGVPQRLFFDNGIDEGEFSDKSSNADGKTMVFLVAGRLAYRKGHAFLLDALERLPEGVDYQVRIVGEGPEREKIQKKCRNSKFADKVVFTGRIPFSEMEKEYKNADVFIMPSIRETTGAVLLEAMSKGLPVITIDRFGGPVLFDSDSGWLYSGENREEFIKRLSDIIIECISNPELVKVRGDVAREKAKQHLWKNKIEVYNAVYKEVIGR